MRLHPYIFKIIKDGEILFFQGTPQGVKSFAPDKVLEVRKNTSFKGKRILSYYKKLSILNTQKL